MNYRASAGRTSLAITAALMSVNLAAQQRPDSGTLQEQQRLLPALPAPGGPAPKLPAVPEARPPESAVQITPTAFRFTGNSLFSETQLAGLLTARFNQPTDLAGLQAAAREVRNFYQDRGYVLTDVYVPEQALPSGGGPVTLAVVEARVGDVVVRGANIPEAARAIVRQGLQSGESITGEGLDRPVLLIRDLSGYEATATVEPGARTGEASVIVDVRASARQFDMSLGIDNHGTLAAGRARAFANLDVSNLSGHGDLLQARVQVSEIKETQLYRLNYTLPAFGSGKLSVAATRAEYALGKQFAALGASGKADIYGATLMYPLVRSRGRNQFLSLGLEHKQLDDETAVSPATRKRVVAARAALLGNFADEWAGSAFTSYAASLTAGKVSMDDASFALDQGPAGPRSAGHFSKLNIELQRVHYLRNGISLHGSLQAQIASKNLTSAEKMSLGGPAGVRGYPSGEAVGDSGAVLGLEARYLLPQGAWVAGEPISVSAFYDLGTVRFNQDGTPAGAARLTLDSAGIGLLAGRAGKFLLNVSLAWRIGSPLPSAGDPDRKPRLWLVAQKWF